MWCWKHEGNEDAQGCEKLTKTGLKQMVGRVWLNQEEVPETLGVQGQVREGKRSDLVSVERW